LVRTRTEPVCPHPAAAFGLAVASGLLYSAGFPPIGWGVAVWFAWIPLLLAVAGQSVWRGAGLGFVFGLTLEAAMGSWLPGTLTSYFGVSVALAWAGHALHGVLLVAIPTAVMGAALAWASRRGRLTPACVAACVGLGELLRSSGPLADPYALTAASQLSSPVVQTVDLFGTLGVAMLIAGVSASVAALAFPALGARHPRRDAVLMAVLALAAFGYGAGRSGADFEAGRAIDVTVVQPAIAADRRHDAGASLENLRSQLALTRGALGAGTDLVFWPEYAVDFYLAEATPARQILLAAASELDAELVLGAPHYRFEGVDTDYFTSVFLVSDGWPAARYDKMRLVPFAESAPLGDWLRGSRARYRAGEAAQLLPAKDAAIGAFLCGEAMFPDVARRLVANGAELLANPSNDDWFPEAAPAEHQLAVARLRAIENRRWLVRPTVSGISAIVDPAGRVRERAGFNEEAVLRGTVHAMNETTVYQRGVDGPSLAFILGMGVLTIVGGRRSRLRTGGER
jgi:apolipoprotein N-acyltransferase